MYMEKPSFEMIQANKCETEKALFLRKKKSKQILHLPFTVLMEINVPPLSALWGLGVFNADMLRSRRAKERRFHTDIY